MKNNFIKIFLFTLLFSIITNHIQADTSISSTNAVQQENKPKEITKNQSYKPVAQDTEEKHDEYTRKSLSYNKVNSYTPYSSNSYKNEAIDIKVLDAISKLNSKASDQLDLIHSESRSLDTNVANVYKLNYDKIQQLFDKLIKDMASKQAVHDGELEDKYNSIKNIIIEIVSLAEQNIDAKYAALLQELEAKEKKLEKRLEVKWKNAEKKIDTEFKEQEKQFSKKAQDILADLAKKFEEFLKNLRDSVRPILLRIQAEADNGIQKIQRFLANLRISVAASSSSASAGSGSSSNGLGTGTGTGNNLGAGNLGAGNLGNGAVLLNFKDRLKKEKLIMNEPLDDSDLLTKENDLLKSEK